MEAVDSYIPTPVRDVDKPFLMPIEDVFGIKGRGTVATGRIERGMVKTGETVEQVGIHDKSRQLVVTGVEMFKKTLDEGKAGDNVGLLLRGIERDEIERGQVLAKPGSVKPGTKFKAQVSSSARRRAAATRRSMPATGRSSTFGRRTSPAPSRSPRASR